MSGGSEDGNLGPVLGKGDFCLPCQPTQRCTKERQAAPVFHDTGYFCHRGLAVLAKVLKDVTGQETDLALHGHAFARLEQRGFFRRRAGRFLMGEFVHFFFNRADGGFYGFSCLFRRILYEFFPRLFQHRL